MFENFRMHLERLGRPENTIKSYVNDLNQCEKHCIINTSLTHLNMSKLATLAVSNATKHRFKAAIKKYASFLAYKGLLKQIPNEILFVDLPPIEPQQLRDLPTVNIEHPDPEIKALLHILYSTGARIDSINNLKVTDIKETSIEFNITKGNRPYISVLLPQTKSAIENYLIKRKVKSEYLFCKHDGSKGTTECLRVRLKRKMGNNYINPHTYRHCLATSLIDNGMDLNGVAETLNHSSTTVTKRYLHSSVENKGKRLQKVHPMLIG